MAVSTIKDLWELAATYMGGNYASEIIDSNTDMSNPTTPLERTFDQVYDVTRRTILEQADWLFARNFKPLRLAPRVDAFGNAKEWDPGGHWAYAYEEPRESIQFLGFLRDYAHLELVQDFQRRPLPLTRHAVANTSVTTSFTTDDTLVWSGASFAGRVLFPGSVWAEITDNAGELHRIEDVDHAPVDGAFRWQEVGGLVGVQGYQLYNPTPGMLIFLDDWDWDWSSAYGDSATINYIASAADTDEWDPFIFTNQRDAVGVYTVDVTDPSKWPSQFQKYMALELALEGAAVHAKSSKQISLIDNRLARAKSDAYLNLTLDSGNLTGRGALSTTTQARR